VAVQLTVVEPSGNVSPLAGVHVTVTGSDGPGAGSAGSVAVTLNATAAPAGPVASVVTSGVESNAGGVTSPGTPTAMPTDVSAAAAIEARSRRRRRIG
jgi:hypothetical protein